jgi:multiple sugar transport system permease protein
MSVDTIDRPGRWTLPSAIPYAFVLPSLGLVAAVSFFPLGFALVQSVFRSDYLELGRYIGSENFTDFVYGRGGADFVWNSLVYCSGTVAIAVPLGFGLALAMNGEFAGRDFFRTVLVLPWLVSNLVAALLWGWLANPQYSPLVGSFRALGLATPDFITNSWVAMTAVIICNAWASYPLVMVLVLAALQTVPAELLESAEMDGADGFQRFRYVTLPIISGTTLVALVLTTLHAFKNVEIILIMTGGGPVGATGTMALRVFQEGFQFFRMGVASAGAVVVFATNVVFTLAFMRILRQESSE